MFKVQALTFDCVTTNKSMSITKMTFCDTHGSIQYYIQQEMFLYKWQHKGAGEEMFTNLCSQARAHGNQVHLKSVDIQLFFINRMACEACTLTQPQK